MVKMDPIKYFKADIIIEAVRDLFYLSHIKQRIDGRTVIKDDKEAIDGTVKIVTELIGKNYCKLATWGKEKGSFEEITMTPEELYQIIEKYNKSNTFPFDFFLISTEKSKQWVARHEKLIDEL